MTPVDVRSHLVRALKADLVGPFVECDQPGGGEEVLPLPPSRRYLTGFLAPQHGRVPDTDDEDSFCWWRGMRANGTPIQAEEIGGQMETTAKGILRWLGYPRSWAHADEAILALRERGFVVSLAAQEIIRRYGGLDTARNGAPGQCYYFSIDPRRYSQCDTSELEAVHKISDVCPIGFGMEGLGLMGIGADNTIYFEAGPFVQGETIDEVVEKLLTGQESGNNCEPDDEE